MAPTAMECRSANCEWVSKSNYPLWMREEFCKGHREERDNKVVLVCRCCNGAVLEWDTWTDVKESDYPPELGFGHQCDHLPPGYREFGWRKAHEMLRNAQANIKVQTEPRVKDVLRVKDTDLGVCNQEGQSPQTPLQQQEDHHQDPESGLEAWQSTQPPLQQQDPCLMDNRNEQDGEDMAIPL